MTTVKTAISLQNSLFEQVEALSHKLNVSRSQLIALALEDFIEQYQNRQLLDDLNQAYVDSTDADQLTRNPGRKRHHRRIVEGEW